MRNAQPVRHPTSARRMPGAECQWRSKLVAEPTAKQARRSHQHKTKQGTNLLTIAAWRLLPSIGRGDLLATPPTKIPVLTPRSRTGPPTRAPNSSAKGLRTFAMCSRTRIGAAGLRVNSTADASARNSRLRESEIAAILEKIQPIPPISSRQNDEAKSRDFPHIAAALIVVRGSGAHSGIAGLSNDDRGSTRGSSV